MFTQELINDGLKSYIKIAFDDEKTLDSISLQKLNGLQTEAILPSKVVYESNLPVLWFSIENKLSLNQWVEKHGKLKKRDFIHLMTAIIEILLDEDSSLSPYYYILSTEDIFIDPQTRKVSLTYIPDYTVKAYFLNRMKGMVKQIVPRYVYYSKAEKLYAEIYDDIDSKDFNVMKLKNTIDYHRLHSHGISFYPIKRKISLSLEGLKKHSKHMIYRMKKENTQHAAEGSRSGSEAVLLAPSELDQTGHFLDVKSPYLLRVSNNKRHPVNLEAYKNFIIGRSDSVALSIEEGTLSQEHVKIERSGDVYHIKDLDSLNGTHINGIALNSNEQHVLKEGDEIEIADIKFIWKVMG